MGKSTNGRHEDQRLVLKRWTVRNWMNFREAEFSVQDRLFIVGPNASGKSNLLDSLRFLRDVVAIGGGLQEALRSRGGLTAIRCLAARARPAVEIGIELGFRESEEVEWRYELALKQDNKRTAYIERETVAHRGKNLIQRPDPVDRDDEARLLQTALEQVTANRDFRAIADFLASVEYLHLVPQLIRDPERSVGRKEGDPYGGDFLLRIARTPERTRNAWLRRIRDGLRIAVPQLSELVLEPDERGVPHLRGRYEHWRPRGAWQDEKQFSDGTLRLIGLLWSVLAGGGPILLEEPELSLHGEIVRQLPRLLQRMQERTGRQVFLSTHSGDLLRDGGIGEDEVLLLLPKKQEGTEVRLAKDDEEARALLAGGLAMSEVVIPRTAPGQAGQLSLFDG